MEKKTKTVMTSGQQPTTYKSYLPGVNIDNSMLVERARKEYATNERWQSLYQSGRFVAHKAISTMLTVDEMKAIKPTSWNDQQFQTTPTLATLRLYRGSMAEKFLLVTIADLVDFYGAEIKLPGIKMATSVIMSEYPFLTVGDINFCFTMGAANRLKKYGKWTPSTLLDWVEQYNNERIEIATNKSQSRKPKPVNGLLEGATMDMPEKTKKLLERLERIHVKPDTSGKSIAMGFDDFYKSIGLDPVVARKRLVAKWTDEYKTQGLENHGAELMDFVAFKFNKLMEHIQDEETLTASKVKVMEKIV